MKRVLVLALLAGCTEYTFPTDPSKVWGEPNPADPQDVVQTDRVLQVIEPVVDALWIVDNSLSMADDRAALAEAFPLFIEPFQDAATDWHVGVVTTDMERLSQSGKLIERQGVRWIDPETPHPVEVFSEMTTTLEASLTGVEKGRQAAYEALSEHIDGFNAGFRREGAYLHITVVTDEDDDTLRDTIGKSEFVDFVNGLTDPTRNTFNSVVALSDGFQEERGQKYIDLTDQLGGIVLDLNGGDWDGTLDRLGGLQTPPPTDEFFLSAIPVPDTIEVLVVWSGITWVYVPGVDYEWNRQRNSVQFLASMPPMGSAVQITYTVASSQVQ